eukprot:7399264-Pyramimonas_sp.AAC.1
MALDRCFYGILRPKAVELLARVDPKHYVLQTVWFDTSEVWAMSCICCKLYGVSNAVQDWYMRCTLFGLSWCKLCGAIHVV